MLKELLHISMGIIVGYAHSKLIDLMIDYYSPKQVKLIDTMEEEVDEIIEEAGEIIEKEVVKEVEEVVEGWFFN